MLKNYCKRSWQKQPLSSVLWKYVVKNMVKFTGKQYWWSAMLLKLRTLKWSFFTGKELHHRCFPLNMRKLLQQWLCRTPGNSSFWCWWILTLWIIGDFINVKMMEGGKVCKILPARPFLYFCRISRFPPKNAEFFLKTVQNFGITP